MTASKHFSLLLLLLLTYTASLCQTAVPMSVQPALTYFQPFDSIAAWGNGFSTGPGAAFFAPVATGGSNTIPDALTVTTPGTTWVIGSTGGLQKDTVNGRLMMLATGTANNTNSVAFDLFVDFTGATAGILGFDWQTIFNGAANSNRNGCLKVYTSDNGSSFTELASASLTITNYITAGGTVDSIALPASFTNNPNARIRFYYYNAPGGTTGSRPILALDNIKVTAAGSPCTVPAALPTSLNFSGVTATTIQGTFTAATPAPDEYLVVATPLGSLTGYPADSTVYNPGDIVGDGTVIYRGSGTSFMAANLSPQTNYTFFIFPVNIYCSGVIRYLITNPLSGTQMTTAGPPCQPPTVQPSNLQFGAVTTNSIAGSFSGSPDATEYLVVISKNPVPGGIPVNGTVYNTGDVLGSDTVAYRGGATNFVATGLSHSTTYYFFVYGLNAYACSNGPAFLATGPLAGTQATNQILPCAVPGGEASNLILDSETQSVHGFFDPYPVQTDGYLVVMSLSNTLSALPQNNTVYAPGTSLGGGEIISAGTDRSFSVTGLIPNTTYHFFIFSYNQHCLNGPLYRTASYLYGNTVTQTPAQQYYFGNLHAHSAYSDGNKDNGNMTPAANFAYAQNALCMDFLGISEHNHYTASDNPGMLLANYHAGLAQAASYSAANPGFLALYGMEWGTLNNGGHVLVYGIDSLIGWETLNGSPNYDIRVTKNDFLSDSGLFRKVIDFAGSGAFATLAHPGFSDFGNLGQTAHHPRADSAVSGIAVESGPAFSTSTSYNDPGNNMAYLPYYQQMLAKGYRVGPMIDHDNHNTNFGTSAYTRTAVIAPSLSKTDFLQSMKNMSFYATQDCDTRARILVYGSGMGQEMIHAFAPAITVTAADPSDPTTVPVIRLMSGRPGSGTAATEIHSAVAYYLNFTDLTLPDSASAYYYADIMIGNNRTITAPIWYQRADTIPATGVREIPYADAGIGVLIRNNPAGAILSLALTGPERTSVSLSVCDLSGRRLINRNWTKKAGSELLQLPIDGLSQGLYLLEIRTPKGRTTRKFVHY